jgi:sec-independent protein translocase protein TatA
MVMGIENPVHLIFIAAVALVVLGPKRLPELAKALGSGIREFREAINSAVEEHPAPPPATTPTATAAPPAEANVSATPAEPPAAETAEKAFGQS